MTKLAHRLEKLASVVESASLEKQAKNAHEIMRALRNAAVDTSLGTRPNALPKMMHNLGKRNEAVKKVMSGRLARLQEAEKSFSDLVKAQNADELGALAAGGAGKLKGSLANAYKELAAAGNRVPQDVFLYEKSPAGMIDSVSTLKKLEGKKYPVHSAF